MSDELNLAKVNVKLKWIVKNFSREKFEENENFRSTKLQVSLGSCLTKWSFSLKKGDEGFLFLGIKPHFCPEFNFSLKFKASILDHEREFERESKDDNGLRNLGWRKFMKLSKIFDPSNKYIEDKCLIINFEIKLEELFVKLSLSFDKVEQPLVPHTSNYSKFYNDKKFSDFIIKCSDGINLPAHRIVLAYSSEVFMNMLTVDMEEKKSNLVHLEDVTSETMKVVLKFIYTGKIKGTNPTEMIKVLNVAEKYQISALKSACCEQLIQCVKKENVIEILIAADLYNLKNVEEKCFKTIVDNYGELKSSEELKQLCQPLLMKILDKFYLQLWQTNFVFEDNFDFQPDPDEGTRHYAF